MTDEIHLYKTNAYVPSAHAEEAVVLYKTNAYAATENEGVIFYKTNAYIPTEGNPYVRLTVMFTQVAEVEESKLRLTNFFSQDILDTESNLRLNRMIDQVVLDTESHLRVSRMITQVIYPEVPEPPMSNTPLPGFGNSVADPAIPAAANPATSDLPGLTFSLHKIPMFKTNVQEAASGNEVRNSLTEYPRWEFQLEYEFLTDIPRSTGVSSIRRIMGMFLSMRGRFDSFLVKDPDDYLVENNSLGVGDGLITQYYFMRDMGGFQEIINQVDTVNDIDVFLTVTETHTIPATPGPYTVTVDHAASFVEDVPIPANPSYTVLDGVYTFTVTNEGQDVDLKYRYLVDPADYTITLPNLLVFDTAPADDVIVSASFQFYFACRFVEDQMDFEKFMDKLWNLQQCNFKSVIQ